MLKKKKKVAHNTDLIKSHDTNRFAVLANREVESMGSGRVSKSVRASGWFSKLLGSIFNGALVLTAKSFAFYGVLFAAVFGVVGFVVSIFGNKTEEYRVKKQISAELKKLNQSEELLGKEKTNLDEVNKQLYNPSRVLSKVFKRFADVCTIVSVVFTFLANPVFLPLALGFALVGFFSSIMGGIMQDQNLTSVRENIHKRFEHNSYELISKGLADYIDHDGNVVVRSDQQSDVAKESPNPNLSDEVDKQATTKEVRENPAKNVSQVRVGNFSKEPAMSAGF